MNHALVILVLLLFTLAGCASAPTRDDLLQSAINAGQLACVTALADPATEWAPGAKEYCEAVANGCSK